MRVVDRFRRGRTPVEERLDRLEQRVDAQADRLRRQADRLGRQRAALDQQARRLTFYTRHTAKAAESALRLKATIEILGSQVAALEVRLAELTDQTADARVVAGGGEMEAARSLLAEVRTEHARIRERFGVVAAFEERLRRLEDVMVADTPKTVDQFHQATRRLAREFEAQESAGEEQG
jgi:hypothetical protein